MDDEMVAEVLEQPVDHREISATVHRGCIGLPQELIDSIMDILQIDGDIRALKACSLTCKAMLASAQRLIHQTLRLTRRNAERIINGDKSMDKSSFLQYTRQVHISMSRRFNPGILQPYLRHFQSLDRVHTLTIENYDASAWDNHYFAHLYPTVTSLAFHSPSSCYRALLQFALQFPNLESLCLESLVFQERIQQDFDVPIIVDKLPPLRGHLRLAGINAVDQSPVAFIHQLPNGINFRSVELDDFLGNSAQSILNLCAHTLENLIIAPGKTSTDVPLTS